MASSKPWEPVGEEQPPIHHTYLGYQAALSLAQQAGHLLFRDTAKSLWIRTSELPEVSLFCSGPQP